MKKSSWIVLGICIVLVVGLLGAYFFSPGPPPTLNKEQAIAMVEKMEDALRHKRVNTIMDYIAPGPDTHIANVNPDQLRGMLVHYFRNADSLHADMQNYVFNGGDQEADLQFDLTVFNNGKDSVKEDYKGHVTLHLKRVDVSHMMGLYQTKEWRIIGADTTGPALDGFGEY